MSVFKRALWKSGSGSLLFCLCLLVAQAHPAGGDASRPVVVDDDDTVRAWRAQEPIGAQEAMPSLDDGSDDANNAPRRLVNKPTGGIKPAYLRKNKIAPASGGGRGILRKALSKAIGGGIPGAIAGVVQVLSLMWLRTVINYQYRYGSSFSQALSTLYGMGGIPRLYSGIQFALIHAPLSRFVSTAANDGVSVLLQNFNWGPGREVVVAALAVGFFRMLLMPVDTCKTVMQIEGRSGLAQLLSHVRQGRVQVLYSGALANAASSFIGHYPWFYIHNLLSKNRALANMISWATGRNAIIGFVSSIVSDTAANFMRVIKTTKQSLGSARSDTTYAETISVILAADGWRGLFGRGLKTRILGNSIQSVLFTVVWKGLSERWQEKNETAEDNRDNPDTEEVERETRGVRGKPGKASNGVS